MKLPEKGEIWKGNNKTLPTLEVMMMGQVFNGVIMVICKNLQEQRITLVEPVVLWANWTLSQDLLPEAEKTS